MARKKKTPEPAPVRPWEDETLRVVPQTIYAQHGRTREERRHGLRTIPGLSGIARAQYLSEVQAAGVNVPFTGTVQDAYSDRSLRLALRRKARHARLVLARKQPVPDDLQAQIDADAAEIAEGIRQALSSGDWRAAQ